MPLDGIGSKFLTKELNYELADARVDRIYQPDRFTLIIFFRVGRTIKKLLLSANPSSPRIYLTTASMENPKTPPAFCMMLRKHLIGAHFINIIQPPYERVFMLEFSIINELGDFDKKYLVAEVMGRHSNLIFLNKDKKIHDSLIHVDQEISSKREVMPARTYQLPPAQEKRSIEFYYKQKPGILSFLRNNGETGRLDMAIVNNVRGCSTLLARSIVAATNLEDRSHVDQLSEEEKQELSNKFYETCAMIMAGADQPTLYFRSEHDRKPYEFHAFELKSLPYREKVSGLSTLMDVFYRMRDQEQAYEQAKQKLERRINQLVSRAQKKLDLHQKDYEEGVRAVEYQRLGELLSSQLYLVNDQMTEVELVDYFDHEQKKIKLNLNPSLSPSENAEAYFKKYRKAKTKYKSSQKLIIQDQAELKWLHSLYIALHRAEVLDDLRAIKVELDLYDKPKGDSTYNSAKGQPDHHLIQNRLNPGKPGKRKKYKQTKKKKHKQKNKNEKPLPARKFELAEGITVFVGRNNIQNDQLSLRQAGPEDHWFHVKDLTGAHVILIAASGHEVEQEHIITAAEIAAWYSEGNQIKSESGGKIAVDTCLAKYVRKPKGAKPGMVIYDHHQTYYVLPKIPKTKDNI